MSRGNPNPYAAPMAPAVDAQATSANLASRWARLGARIVDTLIALAVIVPVMFASGYVQRAMQQQVGIGELVAYSIGGFVFYLAVHGYLLATRGQTVGKMLVGVRIVDYRTGELLPLVKLVGLRDVPAWRFGGAIRRRTRVPIVCAANPSLRVSPAKLTSMRADWHTRSTMTTGVARRPTCRRTS